MQQAQTGRREGGAVQLEGEGVWLLLFSTFAPWTSSNLSLTIFLQKRLFDLQVRLQYRAGALEIIPSQGPGKVMTKQNFWFTRAYPVFRQVTPQR